nr:MAG TPA: hypothetical protein [Caudoviricetes sp.]
MTIAIILRISPSLHINYIHIYMWTISSPTTNINNGVVHFEYNPQAISYMCYLIHISNE